MKTSFDPRHKRRQDTIKQLFTKSFDNQSVGNPTFQKVVENLSEIDALIKKIAPEFPIEKINKVDLAILRLSIYEITFAKKEPEKVVIDEAIELAKEFGGDSSPGFINGALGKLLGTTAK